MFWLRYIMPGTQAQIQLAQQLIKEKCEMVCLNWFVFIVLLLLPLISGHLLFFYL